MNNREGIESSILPSPQVLSMAAASGGEARQVLARAHQAARGGTGGPKTGPRHPSRRARVPKTGPRHPSRRTRAPKNRPSTPFPTCSSSENRPSTPFPTYSSSEKQALDTLPDVLELRKQALDTLPDVLELRKTGPRHPSRRTRAPKTGPRHPSRRTRAPKRRSSAPQQTSGLRLAYPLAAACRKEPRAIASTARRRASHGIRRRRIAKAPTNAEAASALLVCSNPMANPPLFVVAPGGMGRMSRSGGPRPRRRWAPKPPCMVDALALRRSPTPTRCDRSTSQDRGPQGERDAAGATLRRRRCAFRLQHRK